ncbi:hypothetical protein ACT7DN_09110 [Bacillus paranthracis]
MKMLIITAVISKFIQFFLGKMLEFIYPVCKRARKNRPFKLSKVGGSQVGKLIKLL